MKLQVNFIALFFLFFILLKISNNCIAQENNLDYKINIIKPQTYPLHPIGIFSLIVSHNFRINPVFFPKINLVISNANIWSPEIKVFKSIDSDLQEEIKNYPWYFRNDKYNGDTILTDNFTFYADGVLKKYLFSLRFKLFKNSELNILSAIYYLRGKAPLSLITNDKTIEWFHTNIVNHEDPFARKQYDYHQSGIYFSDINGNKIKISANKYFVPNIQINYHYYFSMKRFFLNTGAHQSLNLYSNNQTVDLGLSLNGISYFSVINPITIHLGVGGSFIRKNIFKFNNNQPIHVSDKTMFSFETMFQLAVKQSKNKAYHVLGINFRYQSAYFKGFPRDLNYQYLIFSRKRNFHDWHLSGTHFFENTQTVMFIYSYVKKIKVSYYICEDFKLNNSPDIQTGIALSMNISKIRSYQKR